MGGLGKSEVKAKFDNLAGENGNVAVKHLGSLVSNCNMPTNAQTLVQIQGALRELASGADISEDGIPFDLFYTWYKLEVQPGNFDHHNELLVRRVIGKVKYPTRNLKDNAFVYGQKNKPNREGAGEVILNWVSGKRSESKETGVSLRKVNKEAVKNKMITPKEVNQFLRENRDAPHLQRPKVVGRKKARGPVTNGGEREEATRESDDIHKIIFPSNSEDPMVEHYIDTSGQMRKGRLPKPRQTKCSELLKTYTKDVESKSQEKEAWKMPKFTKNAKHKIDMGKGVAVE